MYSFNRIERVFAEGRSRSIWIDFLEVHLSSVRGRVMAEALLIERLGFHNPDLLSYLLSLQAERLGLKALLESDHDSQTWGPWCAS